MARGQEQKALRALALPLFPSPRLEELAAGVLAGSVPNAGRFCGACYTPLPEGHDSCGGCGAPAAQVEPVERIPEDVLAILRRKHRREGTVVRSLFYLSLAAGTVVAAYMFLLLPFTPAVILFVALLIVSYFGAANLANVAGDALAYRWSRAETQRRWQAHVAQRASAAAEGSEGGETAG